MRVLGEYYQTVILLQFSDHFAFCDYCTRTEKSIKQLLARKATGMNGEHSETAELE